MKARKYFIHINTIRGTRSGSELSQTVFTKNLKTCRAFAELIKRENEPNYDVIKIVSVNCTDRYIGDYAHIEPRGKIDGIEYGF